MILEPKIADLHCDLLCYLSRNPNRSPYDPAVRCSIPQLNAGNVKLQIMAIFTETAAGSSASGHAQTEEFRKLLQLHPTVFEPILQGTTVKTLEASKKIAIAPAIENASSFCEEGEDLEKALAKLTAWQHAIGKFAYISLTWNTENRFGGGAHTKVGLKDDGKRLLEYLCQRGIALDFSHASDHLAYDLLNEIDKRSWHLPLVASHSNLRAIADVPRNLPDELAQEIVRRGGLIGMNFVRYFVGESSPDNFSRQLEHFLSLGAAQQICFGADFFHLDDVSPSYRKPPEVTFFPSYDHAGTYHKVLNLWHTRGLTSEETSAQVSYYNLANFLCEKIYK